MLTDDVIRVSAPVIAKEEQYSLGKILAIWGLAAAPMGLLAWVVAPAIIPHTSLNPGLVYWLLIIAGMVWQFSLSLFILYRELGTLSWTAIRRRVWLNVPLDPATHRPQPKLFWWLLPCLFASALVNLGLSGPLNALFAWLVPWLKIPFYADMSILARPEFKGQWWLLGLALVSCLFNYFLGEEFFFRGVLLPKMKGAFGRWDWVANGVLFGLYHMHKPWMYLDLVVSSFPIVWPARRFQSNWMSIVVHGVEGTVLLVSVLGVILGLAR
jgi:membrane protease YdiL (CAAX protease family)